jgi:hypothetical protein
MRFPVVTPEIQRQLKRPLLQRFESAKPYPLQDENNNPVAGLTVAIIPMRPTEFIIPPLDELPTSESRVIPFQRGYVQSLIKSIAEDYDDLVTKAVKCSLRVLADGSVQPIVLDAKHQVLVAREKGVPFMMARVIRGLTVNQEAEIYQKEAENTHAHTAIDMFRSGLFLHGWSGDEGRICKALLQHNIIVTMADVKFSKMAPNCLRCVGTLRWCLRRLGDAVFPELFRVIRGAFPTKDADGNPVGIGIQDHARQDVVIRGLAKAVLCSAGSQITIDDFLKVMKQNAADGLFNSAVQRATDRHSSGSHGLQFDMMRDIIIEKMQNAGFVFVEANLPDTLKSPRTRQAEAKAKKARAQARPKKVPKTPAPPKVFTPPDSAAAEVG